MIRYTDPREIKGLPPGERAMIPREWLALNLKEDTDPGDFFIVEVRKGEGVYLKLLRGSRLEGAEVVGTVVPREVIRRPYCLGWLASQNNIAIYTHCSQETQRAARERFLSTFSRVPADRVSVKVVGQTMLNTKYVFEGNRCIGEHIEALDESEGTERTSVGLRKISEARANQIERDSRHTQMRI